jgi:hypothetical protein
LYQTPPIQQANLYGKQLHLIANPFIAPPPPTLHVTADDTSPPGLIESTGIVNFSLLHPRKEHNMPDLILPRGRDPIAGYDDPDLLAGMFPTQFPLGNGLNITAALSNHTSLGGWGLRRLRLAKNVSTPINKNSL